MKRKIKGSTVIVTGASPRGTGLTDLLRPVLHLAPSRAWPRLAANLVP